MPWKISKKPAKKPSLPAVVAKEAKVDKTGVEKSVTNAAPTAGIPTINRPSIFKGYGDLTKAWYAEVKVANG